jgi:hypothetical protein
MRYLWLTILLASRKPPATIPEDGSEEDAMSNINVIRKDLPSHKQGQVSSKKNGRPQTMNSDSDRDISDADSQQLWEESSLDETDPHDDANDSDLEKMDVRGLKSALSSEVSTTFILILFGCSTFFFSVHSGRQSPQNPSSLISGLFKRIFSISMPDLIWIKDKMVMGLTPVPSSLILSSPPHLNLTAMSSSPKIAMMNKVK